MDHYHSHGDPYYGVLELCLNDILSYIKPSESDRLKRLNTINELTTIVRSMDSLKGNLPLSLWQYVLLCEKLFYSLSICYSGSMLNILFIDNYVSIFLVYLMNGIRKLGGHMLTEGF